MKVVQPNALSCKSINGRGVDVGIVVDAQISIALIICDDEDYIGWGGDLFLLTTQQK
jgi:hypothetical protein